MTTYGICYGTQDDTTVIECESLEAARALAHETLSDDVPSVDVVELEGAGPMVADDGAVIADTHAPRRTLATVSSQPPAATLGRRGGRATSPAKAEAARRNGRKGGRPRLGHVRIRVVEVGQAFGCCAIVVDARGRKIAETPLVRPYGFRQAAYADAERLCEERGWTIDDE